MRTQDIFFDGPAGPLEGIVDTPDEQFFPAPLGTAVVAHPNPQMGGTMHNKVVHTMARACVERGWRTVRFNDRGVGRSAGQFDNGRGETQDLLAVVAAAASDGEPLVLAGFSFGTFLTVRALAELCGQRTITRVILVGTAASRLHGLAVPAALRAQTLIVHGERDDVVPLASVLDWVRPQAMPVTVVPGVEHFFHGQLPALKHLVTRHLVA